MTKRSPILLIAAVAIVAALILIPTVIIPAMQGEGTSADLGVAFYDKDGNAVGVPMAFIGPAGEVEDIVISVSYTVTSSEERFEETLLVWGNLLIEWKTEEAGSVYATAFDLPIEDNMRATNTHTWGYDLREIITVDASGKTYGWSVRITATLTSRMRAADDELITSEPWTETVIFTLAWESETLVITGGVGWV